MYDQMIENISAVVHGNWMATKRSQGVTSRLSETGEELMVDYRDLSEDAKDLDRGTVRAVLAALDTTGYELRAKRSSRPGTAGSQT
jgi:hypothetical protein